MIGIKAPRENFVSRGVSNAAFFVAHCALRPDSPIPLANRAHHFKEGENHEISRTLPGVSAIGALALATLSAHAAPIQRPTQSAIQRPKIRQAPTCQDVNDWFKATADYLQNGKVAPGKVPALYATVTIVSIEPLKQLGDKKPDRLGVTYAFGELTQFNFPVLVSFEGKLPLWVNNGDNKAPFVGGTNNTLNVRLNGTGGQTFQWQIDGRNRLGKGPQPFALNAQTAQMTPDFLMYQGSLNFHGFKHITLALVRGEKDGPPAPAKQVVGTRYRITPSFLVTNANDGIADNTVEVQTNIKFFQNGKSVGFLIDGRRSLSKGGRINVPSFEVSALNSDVTSNRLKFSGSVDDYDILGNDTMWTRDMSISLAASAKSSKSVIVPPETAMNDDEAQGNVEIKVEKIADLY